MHPSISPKPFWPFAIAAALFIPLFAGCARAAEIPTLTLPPTAAPAAGEAQLWRNPDKPLDDRIKDLIGRMTLAEKADQMCEATHAIPRLNIPAYNYWNECLHGVARNRSTTATVFPQAIGMAAAWDAPMLHDVADTIATEARAMNRAWTEQHNGDSIQYTGLSFWTPNINLFRDPRWGRGQETYGEDTFLTARLAVAFITGLQGNDPTYIKALACAKHFAVHSGPESSRHTFNVEPSERDLYENYLPHFEAAVREAHVGAVMAAYNAVNGVPAPASTFLLTDILRKKWGFTGHVVSDCGAINDIYKPDAHNFAGDTDHETGMDKAEALAIKAGCDLGCWGGPTNITDAVQQKRLTEAEMDVSLARVLRARFQLGLFDPPARVPYSKILATDHDTPAHGNLALAAARESIVLLKNDGALPLDRAKIKRIAVIGQNADAQVMQLGEYNGFPSHVVSLLNGIRRAAGADLQVETAIGCALAFPNGLTNDSPNELAYRAKAVDLAKTVDVVIYCGGLSPNLENEEAPVPYSGFDDGDRTRIELPATQTALLKALKATGKPVIFVNCSGSAIAMPWEADNLSAIVQAWYPGQEGGTAVADVLFGDVNPAGRLPVTFYRSTDDLPAFTNYNMANRTYRYFGGKPVFAFGHGLSYTKFDYKSVKADKTEAAPTDTVSVTLDVANTGAKDGDEVVQVYFRHVNSPVPQPREALCGFVRVGVPHGQSTSVTVKIPLKEFRYWDTKKKDYTVEAGKYELLVGAASDDIRATVPLTIK